MAAISGKGGSVLVASSDLVEVTNWELTRTSNNPSWASNTSNGYKKRVAGVKDSTGTFSTKYDPTDPLTDHLEEGDEVTLELLATSGKTISVPAIIDELKVACDMDEGEPVGYDVSFSSNGAWTSTDL